VTHLDVQCYSHLFDLNWLYSTLLCGTVYLRWLLSMTHFDSITTLNCWSHCSAFIDSCLTPQTLLQSGFSLVGCQLTTLLCLPPLIPIFWIDCDTQFVGLIALHSLIRAIAINRFPNQSIGNSIYTAHIIYLLSVPLIYIYLLSVLLIYILLTVSALFWWSLLIHQFFLF
jgi:hypothetical protein